MAQLHPTYAANPLSLPAAMQYGIVREIETLQWLRAQLPDSYTIYHSTHIAWMANDRLRNREADFLIVNRAGQTLMVELKTGPLEELTDGLFKTYHGTRKSVVTQCHDVINGLRQRFSQAHGPAATLQIGFLLYCPDHRIANQAAAGIAPEQIVDSTRKQSLPRIIQGFLPAVPDNQADEVQCRRVRQMLAQELQFDIDQNMINAEGNQIVTRLTDDLLGFLGALDMDPYMLRIDGAAGCGKTQILTWFVERARSAQKRCLVVCFNRPLADSLRDTLASDVTVDSLHGLARRLLEKAGKPPDMSLANTPDFFGNLVAGATDVALDGLAADAMFGALIVDEGQDIDQPGYELLKLLLRDGASVVWLQDENQRLFGGRPFVGAGFVRYQCRDNHRTPRRIARFIKAALGSDFVIRNPLQGDAVQLTETGATPDALLRAVGDRVAALVKQGYSLEHIAVLTGRGIQASDIMKATHIGGHPTRRFIGHAEDGTTLFSPGELRVETLFRFKGQQAPVILVCELDGEFHTAFFRRRLYVAATRATSRLEFLLPRNSTLLATLRVAAGAGTTLDVTG
jgi:AAA domain/UvrD-like helicase C-terminal domain